MNIKAIGNYMKVSLAGKTQYVINRNTQKMLEFEGRRYLYVDADEMKVLKIMTKNKDGKFVRLA